MHARVILIVLSLLGAAALLAARLGAQPAPAQAQPRWEYASFLRSNQVAAWQAPDESAGAPDVFGADEKLGGKMPRDKVANVAVTHQPGPEMTYWFKRPAR